MNGKYYSKSFKIFIFFICLSYIPATGKATMIKMGLKQLIERSDTIVHGTVTKQISNY